MYDWVLHRCIQRSNFSAVHARADKTVFYILRRPSSVYVGILSFAICDRAGTRRRADFFIRNGIMGRVT